MTEPVPQEKFVEHCNKMLLGLVQDNNITTAKRLYRTLPKKLRQELDPDIVALAYTLKKPIKQGTTATDIPIQTLAMFQQHAETLKDDYATGRVPTVPKNEVRSRQFERLQKAAKKAAGSGVA